MDFGRCPTSPTTSAVSRVGRFYLFIGDSVPHDVWDGELVPAGVERSRQRPDHFADLNAASFPSGGNAHRSSAVLRSPAVSARCIAIASSGFSGGAVMSIAGCFGDGGEG